MGLPSGHFLCWIHLHNWKIWQTIKILKTELPNILVVITCILKFEQKVFTILYSDGEEMANRWATSWLRLIWVFAGSTAILLVLSCCGSDQIVHSGIVWSGSALFAHTYLSQHLLQISFSIDFFCVGKTEEKAPKNKLLKIPVHVNDITEMCTQWGEILLVDFQAVKLLIKILIL